MCHVRFISVMKYRPLVWRNTHPYLLADRVEDMTPVEAIRDNIKCDRRVALYGFVRGTHLKRGMKVWAPISQTRQRCCVNARARDPDSLLARHGTHARSTCPAWATTSWPMSPSWRIRARCRRRKRSSP